MQTDVPDGFILFENLLNDSLSTRYIHYQSLHFRKVFTRLSIKPHKEKPILDSDGI